MVLTGTSQHVESILKRPQPVSGIWGHDSLIANQIFECWVSISTSGDDTLDIVDPHIEDYFSEDDDEG